VRDYGRGLPGTVLRNLQEEGIGGGVGLAGMTERLREIGGRLRINSSASGTELVAEVPVRYRAPSEIAPRAIHEVRG
jgi:signal transduction histidine kinase